MLILSFLFLSFGLKWTVSVPAVDKGSTLGSHNAYGSFNSQSNSPGKTANVSYYDEGENMLLLPNFAIQQEKDRLKKKRKIIKKSPKSILQKIYKKMKSKKKIYELPSTTPTPEMVDTMLDEDDSTTTESQKKKRRNKVPRNLMPFHRMQPMKDHKRNRRDTNRSDIYILQDLDEIEFLSHEKDNDIIKAHVKNYW